MLPNQTVSRFTILTIVVMLMTSKSRTVHLNYILLYDADL